MIRKVPFYKILSAIHVVFFTSILCFGGIFITGSLLLFPLLGASFRIGRDVLYDDLDVTGSIVGLFFRYLREALHLMKFLPVSLILILNMLGIWASARLGSVWNSLVCMVILAFLTVFALYTAGYDTFVGGKFTLADVAVAMFLKPLSVVSLLILMILCIYFFNSTIGVILLFSGTFFLFVLEVVIFVTMLYYLKITEQLDGEDKYAYLVDGKKKGWKK